MRLWRCRQSPPHRISGRCQAGDKGAVSHRLPSAAIGALVVITITLAACFRSPLQGRETFEPGKHWRALTRYVWTAREPTPRTRRCDRRLTLGRGWASQFSRPGDIRMELLVCTQASRLLGQAQTGPFQSAMPDALPARVTGHFHRVPDSSVRRTRNENMVQKNRKIAAEFVLAAVGFVGVDIWKPVDPVVRDSMLAAWAMEARGGPAWSHFSTGCEHQG
jgi:hypothetical protein